MGAYRDYRSIVFSSLKVRHGWNGCSDDQDGIEHLITDGFQLGWSVCRLSDFLAARLGLFACKVRLPVLVRYPYSGGVIKKRFKWVCPSKAAVDC